jgi:hypothetical protein
MRIYLNFLYLCVLSITLFSCDTPNTKPKPNDRPSQKEVISYDEVLKLYTCLNKDNLIGNGENNFIWKHKSMLIDLKWEKIDDSYDLCVIRRSIYSLEIEYFKIFNIDILPLEPGKTRTSSNSSIIQKIIESKILDIHELIKIKRFSCIYQDFDIEL